MANNTTLNVGTGGDVIASDDIAGIKHQLVKIEFGAEDSATQVSATSPMPVTAALGGSAAQSATTDPVLVTVANRMYGFRGKYKGIKVLQNGATGVANAVLRYGSMS